MTKWADLGNMMSRAAWGVDIHELGDICLRGELGENTEEKWEVVCWDDPDSRRNAEDLLRHLGSDFELSVLEM